MWVLFGVAIMALLILGLVYFDMSSEEVSPVLRILAPVLIAASPVVMMWDVILANIGPDPMAFLGQTQYRILGFLALLIGMILWKYGSEIKFQLPQEPEPAAQEVTTGDRSPDVSPPADSDE